MIIQCLFRSYEENAWLHVPILSLDILRILKYVFLMKQDIAKISKFYDWKKKVYKWITWTTYKQAKYTP